MHTLISPSQPWKTFSSLSSNFPIIKLLEKKEEVIKICHTVLSFLLGQNIKNLIKKKHKNCASKFDKKIFNIEFIFFISYFFCNIKPFRPKRAHKNFYSSQLSSIFFIALQSDNLRDDIESETHSAVLSFIESTFYFHGVSINRLTFCECKVLCCVVCDTHLIVMVKCTDLSSNKIRQWKKLRIHLRHGKTILNDLTEIFFV